MGPASEWVEQLAGATEGSGSVCLNLKKKEKKARHTELVEMKVYNEWLCLP